MLLWDLNHLLRRVGLVVVVTRPTTPLDPTPTRIWVERTRTYDARVRRDAASAEPGSRIW